MRRVAWVASTALAAVIVSGGAAAFDAASPAGVPSPPPSAAVSPAQSNNAAQVNAGQVQANTVDANNNRASATAAPNPFATPPQRPIDTSAMGMIRAGNGFGFPPKVPPFIRVSVHVFNQAATDIGIGYNAPELQTSVTVFVYPAPPVQPGNGAAATKAKNCSEASAQIEQGVRKLEPEVQRTSTGSVASPWPAFDGTGQRAVYQFADVFDNQTQLLNSEADLFCYVNGNWFIAYRTTAPAQIDNRAALAALMKSLEWARRKR